MNDVYDYTKPPLKYSFNPILFKEGRHNCKIIVNKIQLVSLMSNYMQIPKKDFMFLKMGMVEKELFEKFINDLRQRNIELEVKKNEKNRLYRIHPSPMSYLCRLFRYFRDRKCRV